MKKLIKTTDKWLEANAIVNSTNALNKKLGIRARAKIKRNKNMRFEIYL